MEAMTREKIKLVEDNYKLGFYFASRWDRQLNNKLNYEDILSHCLLGLTKAAIHYDPDKGTKFSTYVAKIIHNEILMGLRKERNSIKTIPISALKINGNDEMEYDTWDLIQRRFAYNNNIDDWIVAETGRNALERTPPKQKKIVELYIGGMTEKNISGITGYSQSYVSRLLKQAREKVREEFYDYLTA
jgi:RNA polymerase sporulation-specific sigma factor